MAYVKIIYQNSPSTATPINAENLNHMDDQIALNDQRLTEIETSYVKSFNGRKGEVVPEDGDYDIGQIAPLTGAQVGQVPVVTNIGTEEDPELVFRMGAGGGAGGHEIIDSEGNTMPQESAMQFPDSHVSDDSTNGRTVVENVKEVTLAELSQETERGMYLATDEESVPIGEIGEDSVSVTASSDTWASLIVKLQSQPNYDYDKITRDSILQVGNEFYRCIGKSSGSADFTLVRGYSTTSIATLYIQNGIGYRYDWANSGSGTNNSSASVTDGTKITLYYGTSSTVINLKTSADYCMMSDGETSVESALNYSTDEHIVGKWIDGSPLYEKTIYLGYLPNNTTKRVSLGLSSGTFTVRNAEGFGNYGNYAQPLELYSSNNYCHYYIDGGNVAITNNVDQSSWTAYLTIRYTKTS